MKDPFEDIDDEAAAPLVDDKRRAAIEREARKIVEDEERKAEEDRILKSALARLRHKDNPESRNNDIVDITLDLAEHSERLVLDGVAYYHGQTYRVTRAKADTMRDIIARGWRHQDEIDGKDLRSHYQAKRQTSLSGKIAA